MGTTKNKNIDRILHSIKDINMKIVIVGKINKDQISFLNKNNVNFENYINISEAKLINCYNEARVLLFPSLYEGFGLPVIEAQRMGVPVITSNISPMKDITNNSASLVNPKDIHDIKKKLNKICFNSKFRKSVIKKGYINSLNYDQRFLKRNIFISMKKSLK